MFCKCELTYNRHWTVYLTSCGLLEAATQRVLGGDGLVLGDLVSMLAGKNYVVAMVLDLLTALCVEAVAGG